MQMTQTAGQALRQVMRNVPSPVTVVTAAGKEEARGITIGSFTSVSLSPPLISFNVERDSQMHDVLAGASRFAVHIVQEEQSHLCTHFAVPDQSGEDQLRAVSHRLDTHNTPILDDVLAVIHCTLYDLFQAGDHSIVVGEVVDIEERLAGRPILYYNSSYCSVQGDMSTAS